MKKILSILFLFCAYTSFAQTPIFIVPPRSSPAVTVQDARWRGLLTAYMPHTHGLTLNGGIDTIGAFIYEDSSRHIWYRDSVLAGGHKWTMVLTQPDVVITGLIQQGTNIVITGSGTPSSPYIINSTGGPGGGISTVAFNPANGFTGGWLNASGPTATLTIGTSLTGLLYGNGTAMGAVTIGAGLNFSLGTLSNTITNNNQLINGNNYISNITGFVQQGTNVIITGAGTLVSPYIINATGSGGISGAGNFPPLFNTGVSGSTITFSAINANANTLFGNFTGSPAAATFGTPSLTSAMFANQGSATTVLIGNAVGNLFFGAVNLSTMVTNVLAAINGGTGISSYTTGDLPYASSSTTLAKLADVGTGNVLLSGGVGAPPLYGKVSLTAAVSGILPIANGGTGTSSPNLSNGVLTIVTGTWPNQTINVDTANAFFHTNLLIRNVGNVGDSLAYVIAPNTVAIRRLQFIGAVSITHNADSSITYNITGGGGSGDAYSIRDTVTCTACGFAIGDNISRISTGAGYSKTDTINNTLFYGKVSQVFSVNSFEVTTYGRMLWTSGLTVAAPAYQSTTAGNTTNTTPVLSIYIGEALSSTVFFVDRSVRPVNFAGGPSDVVQPYTSGTTLVQANGVNIIQLNPASTQATLGITTATAANWNASNDLYITAGGTMTTQGSTVITSLTITAGAGLTIIQSVTPTTIMVGEVIRYHKIGTFLYRWN